MAGRSGSCPSEFQLIANRLVPDIFLASLGAALAEMTGTRQVDLRVLLTGIAAAGPVFAAQFNSATPEAGFALKQAANAAVPGGRASISGAVGTIAGAVAGAFLMGVGNTGMSTMGGGIDYPQVIKGLVLLTAVVFDVYKKQKQGKTMLVSQIATRDGGREVVVRDGSEAHAVSGTGSTLELVEAAIAAGTSLGETIRARGLAHPVDIAAAAAEGRMLLPIDHPDPAHCHLTGTGLTHLGSAATRDAMHAAPTKDEAVTDSMKMFRLGLEGGRPAQGRVGAQPEWFYKGNGHNAVASGSPLTSPVFAEDGGEEPEIAGVYVIGPDGTPFRVGFALANEFSDHVTERGNYLWLAHSKLRPASFGPEMLVGDLPGDVQGVSRIRRGGEMVWEKPFVSGEDNMSHSLANLEHHHFKYDLFRQPGDLHVHFFGTATLSFADGIAPRDGDVFEIEAAPFGLPLVNPLRVEAGDRDTALAVKIL